MSSTSYSRANQILTNIMSELGSTGSADIFNSPIFKNCVCNQGAEEGKRYNLAAVVENATTKEKTKIISWKNKFYTSYRNIRKLQLAKNTKIKNKELKMIKWGNRMQAALVGIRQEGDRLFSKKMTDLKKQLQTMNGEESDDEFDDWDF